MKLKEDKVGEQEITLIEDKLSNQAFRDRLKRLRGDPIVGDPFEIEGDENTDVLRAKLEKELVFKKYILKFLGTILTLMMVKNLKTFKLSGNHKRPSNGKIEWYSVKMGASYCNKRCFSYF